ncbi:hypothetical protein [Sphingopyxis sp. PAMC25046]|uniref:hypothetical protein n=1 Tax=Sphingopyxis sp. PAMC25046 TaxID=2565556 RepID=UPI0026D7DB10
MILLGRALATGGERGVAVAQIAADPRDEGDEQHGDQQEADEAALQIKAHRIVRIGGRQDERGRIDTQRRKRYQCRDNDRPRRARREQDRADHDLEQEERGEGIGEPAAMVKLPAERRDIEQQRRGEFGIGHAAAATQQGGARKVDRDQHEDRREQGRARQRNSHRPADDPDRRELPPDREPAQLDQQRHVAAARRNSRGRRGQDRRVGHHSRVCHSRHAKKRLSAASANQVSA